MGYSVEYLIVGGGGAGGNASAGVAGGGGGAGGLLSGSIDINPGYYPITVGIGGTSTSVYSTNGSSSIFNGLIAIGGGRGRIYNDITASGGSGGGGAGWSGFNTGN